MLEGVTISESKAQKDELILEGNDVDNVSQSGGLWQQYILFLMMTWVSSRIHPGHLPCPQQRYPQIP